VEKDPGSEREHGAAAELLGNWRAAERDTFAARSAVEVAKLALIAAKAAEEAAIETEAAAKASAEAVERAMQAASRAKRAAQEAAEAARILNAGAQGDKARANHVLEAAESTEQGARDQFHHAQDRGFTKEGS
jgi:hypothetical protein